jgi:hypothetical protein
MPLPNAVEQLTASAVLHDLVQHCSSTMVPRGGEAGGSMNATRAHQAAHTAGKCMSTGQAASNGYRAVLMIFGVVSLA